MSPWIEFMLSAGGATALCLAVMLFKFNRITRGLNNLD